MPEFFSVEEIAKYLRMNTITIYRLASSGKIPAFKVGRHWRFRRESIDKWIKNQENSGGDNGNMKNDKIVENCFVCNRSFSKAVLKAGTCIERDCDNPICANCFNIKGRKHCPSHTLFNQNTKKRQETKRPIDTYLTYISKLKSMELNFIGRFDKIVQQNSRLYNYEGNEIATVKSWNKFHKSEDEFQDIRKILGRNYSQQILKESFPLNRISRYLIPLKRGIEFCGFKEIVLEAKYHIDMNNSISQAGAEKPISLKKLNKFIKVIKEKANKLKCYYITGIFSPFGWDNDTIDFIKGSEFQKGLKIKNISIILIGPEIDTVCWDMTDYHLSPFISFFKSNTFEEEVRSCMDSAKDRLKTAEYLTLRDFSRELSKPPNVCKESFKQLVMKNNQLEITKIKSIGEVIRWKK